MADNLKTTNDSPPGAPPESVAREPALAAPNPEGVFGDSCVENESFKAQKPSIGKRMYEKVKEKTPRRIKNMLPVNAEDEMRSLWTLAWPAVLANLLFFAPLLVTLMFSGQLGKEELDAVALAMTFVNMTGTAVGLGLTTALDTLLSQSFGGGYKHMMGLIVIKGGIIFFLCCFPCWGFYVNIEGFMLVIGEPPDVSKLAYKFVLAFISGLPGLVGSQIFTKYLQNQNFPIPPMIIYFIINIVNAAFNATFIFGFKWGVVGSSLAMGGAYWVGNFIFLGYIIICKKYIGAWTGINTDCLQEWGKFMSLAIPGLLMVALESVNYEIGTLCSGMLGKDDLAVQAVMYQLMTLAFMIPFGIAIATSVRVGQNLGMGRAQAAKTTYKLALAITIVMGILIMTLYMALRYVLPALFIKDNKTIQIAADTMPFMAISAFFDAVQQCCSGVLRGCGRQKLGAIVNFIGFYVVGLPIGLSLMFKTSLRVKGFWIGVIVGTAFQFVLFNIIVALTNWDLEVKKAQERIAEDEAEKEKQTAVSELASAPMSYSKEGEKAEVKIENSKMELAEKEMQPTNPVVEVSRDLPPKKTIAATGLDADINTDDQIGIIAAGDAESNQPTGPVDPTQVVIMDRLPLKTLLWRRGLVLLGMTLLLLVCIIIRFTVPYPKRKEHKTTPKPREAGVTDSLLDVVPELVAKELGFDWSDQ